MQTFITDKSFNKTAIDLDYKRLGKQRVEAMQIMKALRGETKGWRNHPATRMWIGHEQALAYYGYVICREWINRGYKDSLLQYFSLHWSDPFFITPEWITDELILSHRSNLIRKMPEYYGKLWPNVPDDLPYVWPSNL